MRRACLSHGLPRRGRPRIELLVSIPVSLRRLKFRLWQALNWRTIVCFLLQKIARHFHFVQVFPAFGLFSRWQL